MLLPMSSRCGCTFGFVLKLWVVLFPIYLLVLNLFRHGLHADGIAW
jgi:hypothetical protein